VWRLTSCEYWRDGGSYSATLVREDRSIALWLQVSSWHRIEDRTYTALFWSEGTDPTRKSHRVSTGDAEREWLTVLEKEVDCSHMAAYDAERFNGLVGELRGLVMRRSSEQKP
jgi:hypothetical protein